MKNTITAFTKWLFCCFLFISLMLVARIIYAGNLRYIFLVWNLFLAFVPYIISIGFNKIVLKGKLLQLLFFSTWLLFFPNALYIITDIIHLAKTSAVPVWYDAVLLFTSSLLGLVLAFASLINVEKYFMFYFKNIHVNILIILVLFAGSYGVYLGRFERWNSWDILKNLNEMMLYILNTFLHPFDHTKMWVVTFLLTSLYSLFWYLVKMGSKNVEKNINISGSPSNN